jgi:hypothetical protein
MEKPPISGRPLADFLRERVRWMPVSDRTATLWRANVGNDTWSIRVNDFPEAHLYTLLVDGAEVGDFDDWPGDWIRPDDSTGSRSRPDSEAAIRAAEAAAGALQNAREALAGLEDSETRELIRLIEEARRIASLLCQGPVARGEPFLPPPRTGEKRNQLS